MARFGLHHERSGREGQVGGHPHDLHLMAQLGADQAHPLGHRESLLVTHVEHPATGCRLVHGQQDRVGCVLAERPGFGGQAGVGHDDGRPTVEDPSHDAPVQRCDLAGAVDERVAQVGGRGLVSEQEVLGAGHPVALAVVVLGGSWGVLGGRDRQARGIEAGRVEVSPVGGRAAHAHEPVTASGQHLGDGPEAAVAGHHDVERATGQGLVHGFG